MRFIKKEHRELSDKIMMDEYGTTSIFDVFFGNNWKDKK